MTDRQPMTLSCDDVRDLAAGFVLGALEADEMAAVRAHLSACPEAHQEIAELGGVVPFLAESLDPVEPPARLGGRILAAIAAEASATSAPGPTAPVVSLDAERARRRAPLTWLAAVAAVLVIVALGAWNVSLRRDLDGARDYTASVERVLDLASTKGGQAAILAPTAAGGPSGLAAIGADGRVEIAIRGLTPTSGSQVYEAWVVGRDNIPVAIGSFLPNGNGFGSLTANGVPVAAGLTVGLTREPTAGRTTPTPPMLSAGVAAGSS
jgi:anti-sigma-K factor RskA